MMGPQMFAMYNAIIDPIALAAISPTLAVLGSALATGLAAATTSLVAGAVSQVISTGRFDLKQDLMGAAISGLTAGLGQGLLGTTGLTSFGSGITQATSSVTLSNIGNTIENIGAQSLIQAGVQTTLEGGSFGRALLDDTVNNAAAVGANAIGATSDPLSLQNLVEHGLLGCVASAAEGTGCAGGAVGGVTGAVVAPLVRDGLYDGTQTVNTTDNGDGTLTQTTSYNNSAFNSITAGIATLSGGLAAGLAGQNAQAGATSAENEVLNNALSTKEKQLLTHAYSFEMPGAVVTQSDAVHTLADLQVAQKDPNLTPTERNYFTSATLSVYQVGIQSGVLSANNVGPLVSAAIGSMAFSGGGEGPLPGGGASQSEVLTTTTGSRTAVQVGTVTRTTANNLGMPIGETSIAVSGRTGTFEFAGTVYPLAVNASGTTAAMNVADPQASAFSLLSNLANGAPVVQRSVPGGALYQATSASGQTYTLRPFSTTSAQTGVPEWTLQGPIGSLPGGLKEIKFRGQ
jgi:filamentous hemagglutinin